MSAIVCGKRSFFEDLDSASSPPPAYKKFRYSSPARFTCSSSPVRTSPVDQLKALFPDMDSQLLEKAIEESGNDLDVAIKMLQELLLGSSNGDSGATSEENASTVKGAASTNGDGIPLQEPQVQSILPADGAEWVDLFVKEMMSATSIDDARSRAATILESLEKSINSRASSEAAQIHKENLMLKEQIEALLRDNAILKRAVAIQYERQKENDERNQEVHQLKQIVAEYQEQMRTLEMNNYALQLHLRQAQQVNSSMPGRFNPDVF